MILISELRPYVAEKEQQLASVNFSRLVVGEAEATKFMSQVRPEDNQIMLVVIPDARSNGTDEDNIKMNNAMAFMFLEKTDYRVDSQYEKWLDVFERTQESAVAFARQLVKEISQGSCSFNRFLDVSNIAIEPMSNFTSCNGWTVEIYFNTPL